MECLEKWVIGYGRVWKIESIFMLFSSPYHHLKLYRKNNQFAFFAFVKSIKIWIEERKRARAIAMARRMKMPESRSGPEKCRR